MIATIYFAQSEGGPVKIGISGEVARRMYNISVATGQKMTLLAEMPGDRRVEFYFHQLLREHCIRGEWFQPAQAVLDIVEQVKLRGIEVVPPDWRPLPEYECGQTDDMVELCRDYLIAIASPRVGNERVSDMVLRAARLAGLKPRETKEIWYREKNRIWSDVFLRIREAYEARIALGAGDVAGGRPSQ